MFDVRNMHFRLPWLVGVELFRLIITCISPYYVLTKDLPTEPFTLLAQLTALISLCVFVSFMLDSVPKV